MNTGDDTLRLGFEVHGAISYDDPNDVDTYSFQGTAGTEVWLAIERTSFALDSVMELVDADGNVVARSDNLQQEEADPSLLGGAALPFQADPWTPIDDYSTNPYDPAMRVVLPGPAGTVETYYVSHLQRAQHRRHRRQPCPHGHQPPPTCLSGSAASAPSTCPR